jgi:RNA recognition motif-containing protein
MNIYVSNPGFSVQTEDLKKIFLTYGSVSSINIIMDKVTNRSRGFGFVEIPDKTAAEKAISELEGSMLDGRPIKFKEAKPGENQTTKGNTR